ncbi:hypothetical protein H1D32_18115 [Anaerobacillus sp. CMMVII]|nr:hypothetical protein [Anaerobacillus sp. CMMVII]MCT8139451.1 hypothetical protein [Anaerobacillus sp. CMMVII]
MPKADKGLKPGAKIPTFTLEGVDGKTYNSKHLEGEPFLLYFLRGTF